MTDAEMHLLMAFPELRELNLSTAPITDQGLAKIKKLRNLKLLSIRGSRVTDAGLTNISGFKNLEELYLQGSKVSGEGLIALRGLKKLRKLRLDDLPIRDEDLKHLTHLVNLEVLDLSQTQMTGNGLRYLAGLKRLEKLSLMSNAHINGNGLQDLIPLFSMVTPGGKGRELVLGWTAVDDKSLEVLKRFTALTILNVKSTHLSTNALLQLKRALPGTDIQHY